jgi:hypothetical protein
LVSISVPNPTTLANIMDVINIIFDTGTIKSIKPEETEEYRSLNFLLIILQRLGFASNISTLHKGSLQGQDYFINKNTIHYACKQFIFYSYRV